MEIKNAVIKSARISLENRALTVTLYFDCGDLKPFPGRAFGLRRVYLEDIGCNEKNYAGHFLFRVLEIAGADDWDQLKGRAIRVAINDDCIYAIGHIVDESWFNPEHDFAEAKQASSANAEKINSGSAAKEQRNG